MTIRKWPKKIKAIEDEFYNNSNFEMETDVSSFESLYSAYGLISDWSGIAIEYAFVCEMPVFYIDVPQKINNSSYNKIPCNPLEFSIRNLIGKIISPNDLSSLPKVIESTYEENNNFKTIIRGDEKIPAISAASIIAKVARDRYITRLAKNYISYGGF